MNFNSDIVKCEAVLHNELAHAVRFCIRCNIALCSECLIDSHSDHIQDAKLKIDDIINRGKEDYKNLLMKIENEAKNKTDPEKIRKSRNNIDECHNKASKNLESTMLRFESIIESEKELKNAVNSCLIKYIEQNCSSPMYESITKKKSDIQSIINNWDSTSKSEKINFYREKKKLENEVSQMLEFLEKESHTSKVDKNSIEVFNKKVLDFYTGRSFTEKMKKIDNLIKELIEEGKRQCQEIEKNEDIPINTDSNFSNNTSTPIPIFTPTPFSSRPSPFKFLISYKARGQEILILDPELDHDKAQSVILDDNCFLEGRLPPNFPPEYSKSVNLGDSILIAGGIASGSSLASCYHLQVTKKNNRYNIIVSNYKPMSEKRERHNMIFLDDIKSILVCGGFYSKTAEITTLGHNIWADRPSMKEQRANATLLYYNHKTVYCFGGFNVADKVAPNNGVYLGTCESIDIHNPKATWNIFDLEKVFNVNLKLCAMGVIELNPLKFLLVGGYDGNRYLSDLNEIDFDAKHISAIRTLGKNEKLLRGVIFPSTGKFSQLGEDYFNFDFQNRIVQFNDNSKEFLIK